MDPNRALAKADAVIQGFSDVMGAHITRGELLYLLCVAEHETRCGDAWVDNAGNPLHNWGAVQWRKPTPDEMVRIANGDLVSGSTIPGGVLHYDSGPAQGKYAVWFRTFPSDRQGAAFLVGTLYKHDPEARAVAIDQGSSVDFATQMYLSGYFEDIHPTPAERAKGMTNPRPAYDAKGSRARTLPLLPAEAENVADYAGALDKLWPAWAGALSSLPIVGQGDPADADRGDPGPPSGHEAGETDA